MLQVVKFTLALNQCVDFVRIVSKYIYHLSQTMANRVSNEQLEELLDFLAEHPAIAKGVGLGARSKEAVDKQWNDLAIKLNSYGSGSTKSGERWKKYWADLKHKSKTRLSKRRRDALGTGGGPSSQDDLSEVDKKILAIIGEQAVFGDSVHKVPIFNIENEPEEIGTQSENIVSQQIVIHDSDRENLTVVASSSHVVNSPSRSGYTSRVFTDNTIDSDPSSAQHNTDTTARQIQQQPQAGVESPVSRPIADRPRLRRNRAANTTIPSRINPEWVMELERNRVEAENKLANAALIMAEAARVQADTARAQADLTQVLVELIRRQSDDIKALLEMARAANQQ